MKKVRAFACTFFVVCLLSGCIAQQRMLDTRLEGQDGELKALKDKFVELEKRMSARQEMFTELEERVKQERADIHVSVEDLRTELQQVRGAQEELTHTIDLLKVDQQRLRTEILKVEQEKMIKQETDITAYDRTLKVVLEEKDYTSGINKFRQFLDKYPQSSLADNAAYWVGEAFYAQEKYKEAIVEFQNVIDRYPKSDKICAALLKQGLSFENLAEYEKAKLFYEETQERCKDIVEAKNANEQLLNLKKSGKIVPAAAPVNKATSTPTPTGKRPGKKSQ